MAEEFDTRHNSRTLVDGPDRAAARSYFHSVGYEAEDLKKPLVMVAHEWIGTMPCNFSQRALAQRVMEGIRQAGGTPMEVNTISISDGISMGTEGMKASLISRELIADSVELCAIGYSFDAAVVIVGCDKTIPAGAMALARLSGEARFRVVVLDLKLPQMDGLEVLRRIRAAGNATPVVVVTARGEEAQRIEGLQAGAEFSYAGLQGRVMPLGRGMLVLIGQDRSAFASIEQIWRGAASA